MRVVVYDETGEMTLDYDTRSDTLSLCPGATGEGTGG
jgi:hypothetical protein